MTPPRIYFEHDPVFHRLHTYSKGSPFSPDGGSLLYLKFRDAGTPGEVCLLNRADETEQAIGRCASPNCHNAAYQYFCDGGRKVLYRPEAHVAAVYDVASGETRFIPLQGDLCNYSGRLDRHFIERENDFEPERQGRMGLYLHTIDGKSRRKITDVETLLALHPRGNDIRSAGIALRLGAEISPDQTKLLLFLVSRNGTLVRDYFLCSIDGGDPEFLGRLGCHVMYCPDSREIIGCASPWTTDLGGLAGYGLSEEKDATGLLTAFHTESRSMRILSSHPVSGGSHQSPSPGGRYIAVDSCNRPEQSIYLFDRVAGTMREIHRFTKVPLRPDPFLPPSEQRNHAHPAFSADGERICINRCTDGVTRLCELALPHE